MIKENARWSLWVSRTYIGRAGKRVFDIFSDQASQPAILYKIKKNSILGRETKKQKIEVWTN